MTLVPRDGGEIEALVTDRYLDALLAGELARDGATEPTAGAPAELLAGGRRAGRREPELALDTAVRAASRRLAADLPRFHPSFRFEERLALRLAEAAAAMRLPLAAGSEGELARIPIGGPLDVDPIELLVDGGERASPARPLLISGAVAASALSLAGAAWLAWRRRSSRPMGGA